MSKWCKRVIVNLVEALVMDDQGRMQTLLTKLKNNRRTNEQRRTRKA